MSNSTNIRIPTSSPQSSSGGSSNDYRDDALDVDELDRRSRKLTKLLKKNMNKVDTRKSILDTVREKAWLLEDQAKIIQNQASNLKTRLQQRKYRQKVIIGAIALASLGSVYYIWHHSGQS